MTDERSYNAGYARGVMDIERGCAPLTRSSVAEHGFGYVEGEWLAGYRAAYRYAATITTPREP